MNKKGRYVPPKEPEPQAEPVPLYQQYGIDLADPMPWWYPLMHFEAAVGRAHLREKGDDDVKSAQT